MVVLQMIVIVVRLIYPAVQAARFLILRRSIRKVPLI